MHPALTFLAGLAVGLAMWPAGILTVLWLHNRPCVPKRGVRS